MSKDTGDLFGKAVDISDAQNKIIVGIPQNHSYYFGNRDAVYIFDANDGTELNLYYGVQTKHQCSLEVTISVKKIKS